MALTLITNPVGTALKKMFAGFQPIEFIFKREDLQITDTESGVGGVQINHVGDLTSVLSAGDYIYIYSEGTTYALDGSYKVLIVAAGEVTIDVEFLQVTTGGYMNYLKNWYVELQTVSNLNTDVNILPFSLKSDGDASGDVSIDVSIVNSLNVQRGEIETKFLEESCETFKVRYREVYEGSSNSFTLINDKTLTVLYTIDEPVEGDFLNQFDNSKIYVGYENAFAVAIASASVGSTLELKYKEYDINNTELCEYTLDSIGSDPDGLYLFKMESTWTPNDALTNYIVFNYDITGLYDFLNGDFGHPDFIVQ